MFAGFVIGAVPAVAIGLLMAMFRPVRIFFDPLIAALFPIPKIALMPLLLLAFGFGDASKIALVAIAVFFPGDREHLCRRRQYREDLLGRGEELRREPDRDVHPRRVLRRAADDLRRACASRSRCRSSCWWRPSSSPPRAGIGYLIWNSWELLQVDVMFVGIVTVGVLGLITSVVFQEIERKVIPWKAE